LVRSVQLYTDTTVRKELKDLAALQVTDPKLAVIKREVIAHPTATQQRYLLRESVIYCNGDKHLTRWKAKLSTCLAAKSFRSCTTLWDIWVSINAKKKLDTCFLTLRLLKARKLRQ
jgi:hypothetical protein